ncbi:phage/plasmid primase, P4 family [Ruegeria sp. HKCCE3926]|uniref:DNA primase family protein n=1 Tax=Ruegeria sp. HKCCE3926 TaxID=2794831 RepID=UPI001AE6A6E2|nr:phage/plasmid primase, P4 family [Ruegeria sp. HKCCE3926]
MSKPIPPAPQNLTEAEVIHIKAAAIRFEELQVQPIPPLSDGQVPDLAHDTMALELGMIGWDRAARYWPERERFLFWNGSHWAEDDKLASFTYVRAFLRLKARQIQEWAAGVAQAETDTKKAEKTLKWAAQAAKELTNKATVSSVREMMKSNPDKVVLSDDLDRDPWLLGTPTGTINLRTGEHRVSDPKDLITRCVTVSPAAPGSLAPVWNQFLRVVLNGDDELIAFIQRLFGYALTGLVSEHKFAFLYGTGRNGKGTFLNTVMDILGPYARKAPSSVFLESKVAEHSTNLAGLVGKRFVFGSEIPRGAFWNEVQLKDATGGDTLTARFMRGDFFDFMPQFLLAIAGNNKPALRGVDPAIRDRILMIPFTIYITPDKRDPGLPDKLRQEGPAILRWLIDGCLAWQRDGLKPPEAVTAAVDDYMADEDVLGTFIRENGRVDLTDTRCGTPKDHFVSRYNAWRVEQGMRVMSAPQIKKDMESHGYVDAKMRIGQMTKNDSPIACFKGVELRPAGVVTPPGVMPSVPTMPPGCTPLPKKIH